MNQRRKIITEDLILDKKQALKKMWKIRIFEEMVQKLSDTSNIYGTTHLCIGQEATAVGGISVLDKTDFIVSTHRNHGHCIAKGTDIRAMFSELLGKKTGTNGGKGGSMHIADITCGNLGSNGIVGAGFPIAGGAALSAKMQKTNQVVLCFAGDGATNEGSFHEALNLASIWKLPVVYLIENNRYGMSSSINKMTNVTNLSERAISYGIEGKTIDGNDLSLVASTVKVAIDNARNGLGPILIEALTYRHNGHSKSDQLTYRPTKEYEQWLEFNDPIARLENQLIKEQQITVEEITSMKQEVQDELEGLLVLAKNDDEPTPADLHTHVYSEDV